MGNIELTQEKKREEFQKLKDFLDEVEIVAEIAEKGKLFEDTVLLVSLPTAEELPEDRELTEEELSYFKRGRNAKTVSMAKHATMHDYRHATGFEALMGYLYLTDQMKRMIDLIKIGMERTGGTP